jgi:DNA-binding transcriptional MerR regulator
VSIPTIKYYLREGLLAPGRPMGANQAEYDERHLRRLRVVRALTELGGLTLAAARTVLAQLDGEREQPGDVRRAVAAACEAHRDCRSESAAVELAELAARQGSRPPPDSRALTHAADVLAALRTLDPGWDSARLAEYAEAAWALARRDLDGGPSRPDAVLTRVLLGDALFTALHRLAVTVAPLTASGQQQGNLDEHRVRNRS